MAVRQPWRGSGVGLALLRELVGRARSLGWAEVSLDAQVGAIGFYEREGFAADGEVFDDAGIPHRRMRLALATEARPAAAATADTLIVGDRDALAGIRRQLLEGARRRLMIYQPALDPDSYAATAELEALRRIAASGRGAEIRLLLHDAEAALRQGHRLVALAQRLPSVIQARTPVEEVDLAYGSAYLLTDEGGYLFLPEAQRPQGRAALADRAAQAPLRQHFEEIWARSRRAGAWQPLDL
jgi:hypothetical protein